MSNPIERFDVGPRMSEMAVHNGVAYLAGQVAEDGSQGIEGQTAQVLAAIDKLLERAGTDKSRILRAQIFLADRADYHGRPIEGYDFEVVREELWSGVRKIRIWGGKDGEREFGHPLIFPHILLAPQREHLVMLVRGGAHRVARAGEGRIERHG